MPDAAVHVYVHAGYHKTGTTSFQDFFAANRKALKPVLDYYGKADFLAAGSHARIYAQRPFPWRLWRFRYSLRRFLGAIPAAPVILLSRETFSGGMPGHRQLGGRLMMSYGRAAKPLADTIIAELRRRFGAETRITLVYTTREREAWIRSVYGHLLRSIRITDDFDGFRARFPDLPGPTQEAREMAAYLQPLPVLIIPLEQYGTNPEGPATALLDLLDIPVGIRARLKPAKRSNSSDPHSLQQAFLTLNRGPLGKAALKREKDRLLAEARNPT